MRKNLKFWKEKNSERKFCGEEEYGTKEEEEYAQEKKQWMDAEERILEEHSEGKERSGKIEERNILVALTLNCCLFFYFLLTKEKCLERL